MKSSRDNARAKPRVFGVGVRAGHLVAHDPLTGRTHHRGALTTVGRARLRASDLIADRYASPQELGGSTTVGIRWSPVVRPHHVADVSSTESPHRRVARALACTGLLTVDIVEVEPLHHTDLAVIAEHLTDDGCTVSLTTGPERLRDRADDLAECVDALRVCMDDWADPHTRGHIAGDRTEQALLADIRAAVDTGLPTQLYTRRVPPPPGDESTWWLVDVALSTGVEGITFAREAPHDDTLSFLRITDRDVETPTCGSLAPLDIVLDTVSAQDAEDVPSRTRHDKARPG